MAETILGNVIVFLNKLGVYDVILPFLLVFTIVYAILDKTMVLGKEGSYPRRNLNAMVAFVVGFLVVASGQLVALINEAMANIIVLLLVGVSYLMLVGTFYQQGERTLQGVELKIFLVINFLGVFLIFLHAIPTESGGNWLAEILDFLAENWQRDYVGAVILIALVVWFMHWIVYGSKQEESGKESGEGKKGG